ncbi:hypothetical protein [Saccharothrix sp. HUAS TT1]|uniref:hypothetical protein n=1 Tax=unclassified Saccharothrix TaxID=2593673 RepID=UPI00345BE0E7
MSNKAIQHGTPDGYRQHLRTDQPACEPCTTAATDARRAAYLRDGHTNSVRVPAELLGVIALWLRDDVRAQLDAEIGPRVIGACIDRASAKARQS